MNILAVSGTGRNVGKTLFCTKIITNLSQINQIIAIKVSPHIHQLENNLENLVITKKYSISIDNNLKSNKDSSRMLRAGAKKAYYVQSKDENLNHALNYIFTLEKRGFFVIESAHVKKLFNIQLSFLIINQAKIREKKYLESSKDIKVVFKNNIFDFDIDKIKIDNEKGWILK